MKKIIIILISILTLTGCFNYEDVNRLIFVTTIGVDVDENDNPVLYVEAFSSVRVPEQAGGRETRLMFTASGKTMFEAIRNITKGSAYKLNYTQNKAVIFSERAAKLGLDNFLDVLIRDQELLVRQFVYISKLDIEELMKMELQEEMFLGVFLFDLSENIPILTERPYMRIDEFYVRRKLGSKINGLFIICKLGNPFKDRIELSDLAVMDEDKMIAELDHDEVFIYSIMDDNLRTGFISVPNPDVPDKLITLEVLKTKTKTIIQYDGGNTVDVIKEVDIRATVAEIQEAFTLASAEERESLEKNAEDKIKEDSMALYEKYKEEDIDIYNLKRDIDIKYPNANINEDNFLDFINFIVKTNVFIEGSTDVISFY